MWCSSETCPCSSLLQEDDVEGDLSVMESPHSRQSWSIYHHHHASFIWHYTTGVQCHYQYKVCAYTDRLTDHMQHCVHANTYTQSTKRNHVSLFLLAIYFPSLFVCCLTTKLIPSWLFKFFSLKRYLVVLFGCLLTYLPFSFYMSRIDNMQCRACQSISLLYNHFVCVCTCNAYRSFWSIFLPSRVIVQEKKTETHMIAHFSRF